MEDSDNYIHIVSKASERASIISAIARLIAPVVFSINPRIPFVFSLIPYSIILILVWRYSNPRYHHIEDKCDDTRELEISFFKNLILILRRYREFLILSLISLIVFIGISNYSQFMGPFLNERGLLIIYLGLIYSAGSVADYFGAKIAPLIDKKNAKKAIFAFPIIIFAFIGIGDAWSTVIGGVVPYC